MRLRRLAWALVGTLTFLTAVQGPVSEAEWRLALTSPFGHPGLSLTWEFKKDGAAVVTNQAEWASDPWCVVFRSSAAPGITRVFSRSLLEERDDPARVIRRIPWNPGPSNRQAMDLQQAAFPPWVILAGIASAPWVQAETFPEDFFVRARDLAAGADSLWLGDTRSVQALLSAQRVPPRLRRVVFRVTHEAESTRWNLREALSIPGPQKVLELQKSTGYSTEPGALEIPVHAVWKENGRVLWSARVLHFETNGGTDPWRDREIAAFTNRYRWQKMK